MLERAAGWRSARWRAAARATSEVHSRRWISGRALLPRHGHQAGRPRMGRSRPLHPFQGPLIHRSVCGDGLRGYLPIEELKTFDKGNSRLQGHPDVTKLPGIDTSTGSLGQGLSVGLGLPWAHGCAVRSFTRLLSSATVNFRRGWSGKHCTLRRVISWEISPRFLIGTACSSSAGSSR